MKEALAFVWSYTKKHGLAYGMAIFLTIVVAGIAMINPYATGMIVGEVIQNGHREKLALYLAMIVGAALAIAIIRYIYLYLYEDVSQKVVNEIRGGLYRKFQKMDFRFFDQNRVGDLMSRLTGDTDAIRIFLSAVVYQLVYYLFIFCFALVMMFTINVKFTLILLILTPFIVFFGFLQAWNSRRAFHDVRDEYSALNSMVTENVSGNRVVKAFAKEWYEIQKFDVRNEAYRDANLRQAGIAAKYIPILDTLAVSMSLIMLFAGGLMCFNGSMGIQDLVMINGYLWMVNNPLRMIGWLLNDVMRFVASYDKLRQVIYAQPAIENLEGPVNFEIKGAVEFRNVSFRYDKEMILKNVSFKAKPGDTVAIIGATGAGKTTLVNLITRFYDTARGMVLVDRVNVRNIDKAHLRKHIAVAMQDVFLFSDTIEGNIAYGKPNAPMEEVEEAARIAGAKEFIEKFPDGYDTIIGERGVGLSGGQRQRLALARALMVQPSILILDDTTSALDMETEFEVFSNLRKKEQTQTTFIIAHRISSVKDADLILVMDKGEVVEQGTHQELLEMKGQYYDIFCQQMGAVQDGREAV